MAQPPPAANGARMKLGELLLRDGLVSPDQLQRALDEQRAYGGRLGRHLVDLGFLSEAVLLDALGRQLRIPRVDLDAPGALHLEAARYCRADLAEQWGFCPLTFDPKRNVLTVAVSDPEPQLLADIEGFLAMRVEPRVAPAEQIDRALRRLFHDPANAPAQRLAGLQVSRSQARELASASPFREITGPRPQPAPAPPAPPPASPQATLDSFNAAQLAQQLQLQQMQMQQMHLQAQQISHALPAHAMGAPVQPSLGFGAPGFGQAQNAFPGYYAAPSPASPPVLPQVPASAVGGAAVGGSAPPGGLTLEQVVDQISRLEKTLAAQARALRSLVEVLVDKGVLSKAEMARKQQNAK